MIGGKTMLEISKNPQINLAVAIKTNQIRRESLRSINEKHVLATLEGFTWVAHHPKTLNEAVDDIMKLNVNDIIAFLSNQAVILGKQMELDEIDDLII